MAQQDRQGGRLRDGQGRLVTTLRVSLTDRCNFRCSYCMPPGGLEALPGDGFLSVADLARVVRLTASLGVSRYRLTGGEPLVRRDILDVVRVLRPVDGVRELSMTTNGSKLAALARPLREAGLDRINVSLDSLEAARFARVSGSKAYARVREGIDAAIEAGFPVKINVVVLRDMPDPEIIAFAELARTGRVEVRFLEFMPLCGAGWERDAVYPIPEVQALVAKHFVLCELPRGDAPARAYQIAQGGGRVGFIAPLSDPFCNTCSRIRLTADGRLRPCLFSDYAVDLGAHLRAGADDGTIRDAILTAVRNKPRGSAFNDVPLARMDAAGLENAGGPPIRSIGG
jgi:cyclic pyranopterin phosphate synthase